MQQITRLEQRITAALERVATGLESLSVVPLQAGGESDADEITRLTDALSEEQMANAQWNERLRVMHEQAAKAGAEASARIDELTGSLAAATVELGAKGQAVQELQAEMEAMRGARAAEAAEIAAIVAALNPLIKETRADA